uniref:Uncharacterized protein n=1 Tax=Tanacetum cinerariifolium TaxID=118510 RepID=A0A699GYE4_TANCI|nr:hypothetical protein [Tanacetum cinerariifolium]
MQQIIPELTALCTSLQRQLLELTAKFQAQEVEINRLKERVTLLEAREKVAATRSGDDALIKGRSMDEGEEEATERMSDDSEEMATVLTSMDAATILASGVVDVPTGSGSIPTASTPAEKQVPTGSDVVPTASPVFTTATVVTPYRRRKGKEVMVESETLKKQRVQEKIDAQEYHQFALELTIERRIELITDLVKSNLGWKVKDFRGMSFEEVKAKFNSVWKQMEDFIPMGSTEEAERIKRKGLNLEQESAKKQKTSEEVPEEAMSPEEVPKEKVKERMQLVPVEEVYVEALQVKHPIIDWKETLSNRPPTSDKEMELWVELSRLYEPDNEDQLNLHASGEGLPSKERSSACDDQLQASSGELLIDGGCIQTGGIVELDADKDVTLVDVDTVVKMDADTQGRMEEDVTAIKEINAVKFEPTAFNDEEVTMTMAQTLIKMKAEKARFLDEQMAKRLQDKEIE